MQNREKAIQKISDLITTADAWDRTGLGINYSAFIQMLRHIKALLEEEEICPIKQMDKYISDNIVPNETIGPKPSMSNGDKAMAVLKLISTKVSQNHLENSEVITPEDIAYAINKVEGNHE